MNLVADNKHNIEKGTVDKMYEIYKMTDEAIQKKKTWDEIDFAQDIETVAEFETLEEAEQAYQSYDQDLHGIDSL